MLKIISHTPIYVWFLLAYLSSRGWKARKTYIISWKALVVMPAIMFLWSFYSILRHYEIGYISLWVINIVVGIGLGFLTVSRLNLKFDKQRKLIEISGSWTPLILSISIFSLRYFLGATYGMYPELAGNWALLGIENIATIVSGMFTGRLIAYWRKSKQSAHSELLAKNS